MVPERPLGEPNFLPFGELAGDVGVVSAFQRTGYQVVRTRSLVMGRDVTAE